MLLDLSLAWEKIVSGDKYADVFATLDAVDAVYATRSADPGDAGAGLGLGLSWAMTESVTLGLRYNGSFYDDYDDHQGSLRLTARF